jgi:hypothetical protein
MVEGPEFKLYRGKNCVLSMSFRSVMGPTLYPVEWVPGALSAGVRRLGREADSSSTCVHAVMLISLVD